MRRVVGSIHRFARILFSNVYLIDGGAGDRWLVDTGHWSERPLLLHELRRARISPSDLTGIILTHRHSDHAGNAPFLQRRYGVKVYAHRADAEILAGEVPQARMIRGSGTRTAGLLVQFENFWPARLVVDRALEHGDTIGGIEVHWVPGHTEGSVFLHHEGTRSLLSGDMLLAALPPLTLRRGLALPYSTFSRDLDQAHASLRAFHEQCPRYENLLSGHGPPVLGAAYDLSLRLLEKNGIVVSRPHG